MESTENQSEVNRDELILQQQRQIEKEICDTIPLISELQSVDTLIDEYLDDDIYKSKVSDLGDKYKSIRRTRPDGNCFFRAFAYAYLEYLVGNKEDYNKFRELALKSKEKLVQLGFPQFTLEDFHETFMEVINRVSPSGSGDEKEELHKVFNEQGYSDYVVVYLRLITSGQLQEGADFYQNFIEGNFTIEEFRHQEVEPMYKESDHIHIIALCAALNVGVRVEYMDRGDGGKVVAHDFPEGTDSKVFLLYRPGHYDILYPK
ncbi:ubiquitin thioesterase otubain-like [Condylostylus longicornis]|uniref:ubiquitin thioesterase otubain-like n=1 Tax=Condylostylus longicornis TaxID=2530218 RepID=UPI00244E1238|nr:ubiquitin thioesterase otubain-like [Condylostylus longicornis]